MAFKSYDELINMSDDNPKMARNLVNKAQQKGMSVVNKNNSGYSNQSNPRMAALKRRMTAKSTVQDEETEAQKMASSRKKLGY